MPVKPVFLPFIHTVTKYLADFAEAPASLTVGQVIPAPRKGAGKGAAYTRGGTIAVAPSGARVSIDTEDGALELGEQGFYDVRTQGAGADSATTLASNVDLSESDLSPLDPRELAAAVAGRAPGELGRPGQRPAERRGAGAGAAAVVVSAGGWRVVTGGGNAALQSSFAEWCEGVMTEHADGRSDLVAVIHDVRRRWRLKLALRGAAIAAGCAAAALVGAALTLQWMRFTPDSILLFRILMAMVVAVLAYLCIVRPLLRSVSDEQVALYLEEHEPSLEAAIISAVEAEGAGLPAQSPALVRKLVENAVEKVRAIEDGRRVERNPVRRYSGALGGVLALAAAIFLLGPAYMRHALSALLVISRSVEAAAPYRIDVTPGHTTIPRGADQAITAKLIGFQSDQAVLMIRKSATAAFERVPLIRAETSTKGRSSTSRRRSSTSSRPSACARRSTR